MKLPTINLPLLLKQKQALIHAIGITSTKDKQLLQGILNLLDHIHDQINPPK